MTYELAMKLRNALQEACPVDTGQLKLSIQPAQGTSLKWVIIIGTDDGSINGTPSNQYAAITNNARFLKFKNRSVPNPNYHWANEAVKKWARENGIQISLDAGDEEDE